VARRKRDRAWEDVLRSAVVILLWANILFWSTFVLEYLLLWLIFGHPPL
jgi:hypothetical protein